jgi:hypothetical protein
MDPTDVLVVRREGEKYVARWKCTNLTSNPIAYKIQTTNTKRYATQNSSTIVEAGSSQEITITVKAGQWGQIERDYQRRPASS